MKENFEVEKKSKSTSSRVRLKDKYLSYDEALNFVGKLGITSRKDWRLYAKGELPGMVKPDFIPAHPDGIYKTKGWQGWRRWLGTEKPIDFQ